MEIISEDEYIRETSELHSQTLIGCEVYDDNGTSEVHSYYPSHTEDPMPSCSSPALIIDDAMIAHECSPSGD